MCRASANRNDIWLGKDGSFVIAVPLAELWGGSVRRTSDDITNPYYKYGDVFLMGVPNGGGYTYGISRLSSFGYDNHWPGSHVSFTQIGLEDILKKPNQAAQDRIDTALTDVGGLNLPLARHFASYNSLTSYMLADLIVYNNEKLASERGPVLVIYPNVLDTETTNSTGGKTITGESFYARSSNKEPLDVAATAGIYVRLNETILSQTANTKTYTIAEQIVIPEQMTQEAYNMILALSTDNFNAYAYAGENYFHAAAVIQGSMDWKNPLKSPISQWISYELLYRPGIVSDAAVGETSSFSEWFYEPRFKSTSGDIYQEMVKHYAG